MLPPGDKDVPAEDQEASPDAPCRRAPRTRPVAYHGLGLNAQDKRAYRVGTRDNIKSNGIGYTKQWDVHGGGLATIQITEAETTQKKSAYRGGNSGRNKSAGRGVQ